MKTLTVIITLICSIFVWSNYQIFLCAQKQAYYTSQKIDSRMTFRTLSGDNQVYIFKACEKLDRNANYYIPIDAEESTPKAVTPTAIVTDKWSEE